MSTTLADVILAHIGNEVSEIYTSLPCRVTDVSLLSENLISVQPIASIVQADGSIYELPVLEEIPVLWQSGGGAVMTFPIAVGDDVMVTFSMTSTDEVQSSSTGLVEPFDQRIHDIADAYVVAGLFRDSNQPSPNPENVEIKFNEGSLAIRPDGTVTINTTSTFSVNNTTDDLVDLLNQLATEVAAITTNTQIGPQPILNKAAVEAIQAKIAPFVEA